MKSNFKISKDVKDAAQRLVQSNDWMLVSGLLDEYLDHIVDIRSFSPEEKLADKNAVIAGRRASYEALTSFLSLVGLLGQKASNTQDSFE